MSNATLYYRETIYQLTGYVQEERPHGITFFGVVSGDVLPYELGGLMMLIESKRSHHKGRRPTIRPALYDLGRSSVSVVSIPRGRLLCGMLTRGPSTRS